MSEKAPHEIRRLVERLARRIRVQRAIEGAVTGLTVAAMLAMLALVLAKTGWIEAGTFVVVLGVSATVPLGLALLGWLRHLNTISLAQQLDRTHGLHDRLSTALDLSERGDATEFERAQIRDAARFIEGVEVAPAAPFRRPTDFVPLVALLACFGLVAVLRAPSHDHEVPQPPPIKHDQVLDSATLEMEKNRLELLRKELEGLQDPEAKELLDEVEVLLEQVENQEISEREFLEELERLEQKASEPTTAEQTEELAEKLKEAAEELEKEAAEDLEKEPAAKELVDALKKKDMTAASKAMEKLAEKLANKDLDDKQLERIARIMEKFADKIDPNNKALQKLIEKNKNLAEKLQKKFDNLSEKDKNRLKRAQEELERLKKEQQENAEKESTRQLKKLQRLSKETSEDAKKVLKGEGDRKPTEDTEHDFKNQSGRKQAEQKAQEASEEMKKSGKQQKSAQARELVRKQLREMREAMKRSNSGQDGKEGSKSDAKKGQQMKEFLDRAKGNTKAKVEQKIPTGEQKGSGDRPHDFHGGEGEAKAPGETDELAKDESDFAGKGKGNRELGDETSLDGKRRDEKVDVEGGEGPSRSEIIRAASEEGFATTEYKDVYVDYEEVVEEVMEKEKIPAGYRYYVKRYFQLIKPQE